MNKLFFAVLCALMLPMALFPFQQKSVEADPGKDDGGHFRIEVIKSNSAYAYSIDAIINDSLTTVKFFGGLVGEHPETLWTMKNPPGLVDSARHLLAIARIDTMQKWYWNDAVMDGMVISFKILYKEKEKRVQLDNIWLMPLYDIAVFVNKHLPDKYKHSLEIPVFDERTKNWEWRLPEPEGSAKSR